MPVKRLIVGLLLCQLAFAAAPGFCAKTVKVTPSLSEGDSIRSMRESAVERAARGDVNGALEEYSSAIKMAERAFGKDSTFVADLCFDAGLTALRADSYQIAEENLSKAVRINPNASEARLKLAQFYKLKGRYSDAKAQVQKVLSRHPNSVEAREILAMTYQQEGNVAKATEECFHLHQLASGGKAPDAQVAMMPPPPVTPPPVAPAAMPAASPFQRVAPAAPAAPAPVVTSPVKNEPPKKEAPKKEESKKLSKKQLEEQRRAEQKKLAAEKKREEQKKLAEKKAAEKKLAEARAKKKNAAAAQPEEETTFGLKSRMHGKAVLLTPVNKKGGKPASAESTETVAAPAPKAEKPPEKAAEKPASKETAPTAPVKRRSAASAVDGLSPQAEAENTDEAPAKPKKAAPAPAPAPVAKPVKIEPVKKSRGGLVPPPPPVIPQFPTMVAPPPPTTPPPAQPKPVKPKSIDKPKAESRADSGISSGDDADFLIEWGGGKSKKKGK